MIMNSSAADRSIREWQGGVGVRRETRLGAGSGAEHEGESGQAAQYRRRGPAERKRDDEDESGFDNRRHVRSEQGKLQPDGKKVMHEVNAVGVVAQTVPNRPARADETRREGNGAPAARKAGEHIGRGVGRLENERR